MSLKIVNLCKKFDNKFIIKNVSLEAHPGEILGIFGITGAGKTTLLRTIAGIELSDGGEIHYKNNDLSFVPSTARNIDFPDVSNQKFWNKVFKTKKKSELADGEGQVLALETALENPSDVILLDNSFCQMDLLLREENQIYLRRVVKEKNLTVLLASNDFEEIFQVCDRVAVLSGGEIVQTGKPREVYENPVSAEVARIFGRNNLISARRLTSNKTDIQEFLSIEGNHRIFAAMNDKKISRRDKSKYISGNSSRTYFDLIRRVFSRRQFVKSDRHGSKIPRSHDSHKTRCQRFATRSNGFTPCRFKRRRRMRGRSAAG